MSMIFDQWLHNGCEYDELISLVSLFSKLVIMWLAGYAVAAQHSALPLFSPLFIYNCWTLANNIKIYGNVLFWVSF